MSVITVRIAKGRTLEQKRALAQSMTRAAVQVLGGKVEWVTVLIEEYDRENWATAGVLHADMHAGSAKT